MTKEEALQELENLFIPDDEAQHNLHIAFEMAKEALANEPTPCNMFLYDAEKEAYTPLNFERRAVGHWIGIEYDGYADGYPVFYAWECSECGHEHRGEVDTLTNYCPSCGARMEFFEGEAT